MRELFTYSGRYYFFINSFLIFNLSGEQKIVETENIRNL